MNNPNYYILNIKHEEEEWAWDKPLDRSIAPIFYGNLTCADILNSKDKKLKSAQQFLSLQESNNWIITISTDYLWIYQTSGLAKDLPPVSKRDKQIDIPKARDIKVARKIPIGQVPFIISSMRVNQAFSRSTFSKIDPIKYIGNCVALDSLLPYKTHRNYSKLDCLSALELETLIAKIFEENGFFVPAYRGGSIKNVDLYARCTSKLKAKALGARFEQIERIEIQARDLIKLWSNGKPWGNPSRIIISSDKSVKTEIESGILGWDWILNSINISPNTSAWFDQSLGWLSRSNHKI